MKGELKNDSKNVLIGIVVGIASVLPGVSGGLIAIICGIYERLIEDLSDLRHKLFSDFRFLFTLGSGLVIGMLVCTIVLDYTLTAFKVACMAFFFGLILAQIPEVYSLSGHGKGDGVRPTQIVPFLFGLGVIVALMFVDTTNTGVQPDEHTIGNMVMYCICGILLAISKIVPGISGASLLIALGLFDLTISSIAHLDFYFIIPVGIGLVIGVLGFAKIMNHCLKNYRTQTYFVVMGLTIGSLLIIIQELVLLGPDVWDIVTAIVAAIAGVAVSYGFNLYGKRIGH
ncbi:MAG: DUF368 domain-containing protein [Candidatus Methanomethylophilaceae archaeon]|nr:DUF368 domain-containing protein [Candidatus Methanomethylophilaceae archaeon]